MEGERRYDDSGGGGEAERTIASLRKDVERLRMGLMDARSIFERQLRESDVERARLTEKLAVLERERVTSPPPRSVRASLPVLCRDLARWSILNGMPRPKVVAAPKPVALAVPVGPMPLPPTLDDISAVAHLVDTIRRLLALTVPAGKAFHSLFDESRLKILQVKLREVTQHSERLLTQVERSRNTKDMLWHMMVAQRNEEVNKRRR